MIDQTRLHLACIKQPRLLKRILGYAAIILLAMLMVGCMTLPERSNPYVGNKHAWYTVKKTDTLYSIAWRYGLDYKELAKWNHIDERYIISLGQRLIIFPDSSAPLPSAITSAPTSIPSDQASVEPSVNVVPSQLVPSQLISSKTAKSSVDVNPPDEWLWPVEGKLLNTFYLNQLHRRGIDIAGKVGQPVRATAAGEVVYSGNDLASYGNLIIIKHSETYLSAYAYSQERLVNEGALVKAGSVIAKMGRVKNKSARLHFEIRKNGKPVDPMKYLPKK